jgi:peptidoglycan/LPS O-acetylase OafA/YrhL
MRQRPQLDGLRTVLFLTVFSFHHFPSRTMWIATYGMPVFFVVSGFLITRIILQNESRPWGSFLWRFYLRRGLRIFPIYYLVLTLCVIGGLLPYAAWQFAYIFNLKIYELSLGLHAGEFMTRNQLIRMGSHLWSLSVEEQFYLLYPVLLLITPKLWRGQMLVALLVTSIASRFYFLAYHPRAYYGALLPVCGEYIVWGCLTAYLDHVGMLKKLSPSLALYGSLAAIGLLWIFGNPVLVFGQFIPTHQQSLFAPVFAALVLGLWHGGHTWFARALAIQPLPYFGKMSYGMYLIHVFTWPMLQVIEPVVPAITRIPEFWSSLILTTLLAMAAWHLFESPLNDLKDRIPYRKAPRVAPRPAAAAGSLAAS